MRKKSQSSQMKHGLLFTFKGPCVVKYMTIIVQQDATMYSLFIQGPAEIPYDFATQLWVEPLAWGICRWHSSSETQHISVAMDRWSVEHRTFAVETHLKKTTVLSLWLSGYFVDTSIFIGTTVSLSQYCTVVGEKLQGNSVCRKKVNLQEVSLHLELLRTSNERFCQVLGDQQAEMPLH